MSDLTLDASVVATPDQVSSDLANEAIILDLESGTYFGLNAVGARIWQLIQEETTVEAVRDQLLREYEVSAEQCEQELLNLLEDLRGRGLIKVSR